MKFSGRYMPRADKSMLEPGFSYDNWVSEVRIAERGYASAPDADCQDLGL